MNHFPSEPPIREQQQVKYTITKWVNRIGIPIIIVGAIVIGLLQIKAPKPADLNGPLDSFSSARAMEKLQVIAKEPHPIETPEHDKVRDYLISELEGLGLSPEVQKSFVTQMNGLGEYLPGMSKILLREFQGPITVKRS